MAQDDIFSTEGYNLPYSLEAEQAVLGSIFTDPAECLPKIIGTLQPESFHLPVHHTIFSTVLSMYNEAVAIDFVTLLNELRQEHDMEDGAGKTYLMQLGQSVPSVANVEQYAKIVQEKYYVRTLIGMSRKIIEEATEETADADALIEAAEQRIYSIRQGRMTEGLTHIREAVKDTLDKLNALNSEDRDKMMGTPTGISSVDRLIIGMNPSDLILLAARPGMGKTSFALNIARNVALESQKTVAFFSLEMTKEQLASRLLSSEAMVDSVKMRTGKISEEEWNRLIREASRLTQSKIYLDESSNVTVPEMKARLRRLAGKEEIGLVVIDYLQLMTGSGKRSDNRVNEVSEITRNLKIMAKELRVPIITLSQLSRQSEGRTDHRPMLSDLRDSGSIEQDADMVMFLYRDMYYAKDGDPSDGDPQSHDGECIVRKNRHGEVGTAMLHWDGQFTRFTAIEELRSEY